MFIDMRRVDITFLPLLASSKRVRVGIGDQFEVVAEGEILVR